MQRQAYFLGHAYAAPALHMQRPEKINLLQNYKKLFFQLHLRKKVAQSKVVFFHIKNVFLLFTPVFQFLKKELVFL